MTKRDFSRLQRSRHPMPDFVRDALRDAELMQAYEERPPYQQNDYVGWISRAKRPETQQRRLAQMLEELEAGDRYMNMDYKAKGD